MTRDTSSTASSSRIAPLRPTLLWVDAPAERDEIGEAYTLGKDGALSDVGLDPPVSVREFSGESGRDKRDVSLIRERDMVRSRDWARLLSDRGLVSWSFNLASSKESEPRLRASSP